MKLLEERYTKTEYVIMFVSLFSLQWYYPCTDSVSTHYVSVLLAPTALKL